MSGQRGLTLIELMIGLVVGLLVIGMVSALFLNTTRSYRQDERISGLNDELRFAVGELISDLEMAGFYGTLISPGLIRVESAGENTLGTVTDCGTDQLLNFSSPIGGVNEADGTAINALFPCVQVAEVYDGIDGAGTAALRLNRVSGSWISQADLAGRRGLYLQTLSTVGGIAVAHEGDSGEEFDGPLNAECAAAMGDPCRYWEARSSIYFVRNFTSAGDGVPCLVRKRLRFSGANLAPVSDCLVSGVEDLHIEFGLDLAGDGVVDFYTSALTASDERHVVAVQLHALLRSAAPDASYRNSKTYRLGDKVVTPGEDGYYRRVASIAVPLRNLQAQRTFQ